MPVLAGCAIAIVTFLLLVGRPVVRSDEAWFVWVTRRINSGDVLYRDVYFVSSPLAVWISTAVTSIAGNSVAVIRAITATIFGASAGFALAITAKCGLGTRSRATLVGALVVFGSPAAYFVSVYSSLAIMLTLGVLWSLLRASDAADVRSRRWCLVGAGILSGLAFTAKPNVGLAALSVTVVAVAFLAPRSFDGRELVTVIGAFVTPVVAMVGLLMLTGGLNAFLGDAFAEKTQYVDVFRTYLPSVGNVSELFPWVRSSQGWLHRVRATAMLFPVLLAGVFVVALMRTRGQLRRRAVLVALFGLVALAAALPIYGPQHATEIAPLLLTAMAGLFAIVPTPVSGPSRAIRRWAALGCVALVATGCVIVGANSLNTTTQSASRRVASPPSTRVATAVRNDAVEVRDFVGSLKRLSGGTVFVIRPDAAYYYLQGRLRNPTRFDFPEITDLGTEGETGVIRLLRSGRVRWICIPAGQEIARAYPERRVQPLRLITFVETSFRFHAKLRYCNLYEYRTLDPSAQAALRLGMIRPPQEDRATGVTL